MSDSKGNGGKMETLYSLYDFNNSVNRINEILDSSDNNYEEQKSIPNRSNLTFTNGYYVYASAIYADIRGSKSLADKYKRPKLAKIYRSYISEIVAVMKGNSNVNEVYIEGDCVWGIFDTQYKWQIDEVFSTAAQIASLIDILNFYFSKKNIEEINIGIGIAYNSALYIKAGYKGSGINEVVWIGKLVGEAAELCSYGNKEYYDKEMMVSETFYENLNDDNKRLLEGNNYRSCYHGYVINIAMDNWLKEQKRG
jgi:class 3 adenylate cyclase